MSLGSNIYRYNFNKDLLNSGDGASQFTHSQYYTPDISGGYLHDEGELGKDMVMTADLSYLGHPNRNFTEILWIKKLGDIVDPILHLRILDLAVFREGDLLKYKIVDGSQLVETGELIYVDTGFSTVLTEEFKCIALVWENAAGTVTLYENGVEIDVIYTGTALKPKYPYNASLFIDNYLESLLANTALDDVQLFWGDATAQEIADIYTGGRLYLAPYSTNYTDDIYYLNELIDYTQHNSITNLDLTSDNVEGEGDIYWNDTETTPTTSDKKYIDENITVVFPCLITSKFIGENGQSANSVKVFRLQLPDPIIDKDSQEFEGSINVRISRQMYMWGYWIYTTDGTEPSLTNGEKLYSSIETLTFTKTTTLKIYLYDDVANYGADKGTQNFIPSNIVERTYTQKFKNPYSIPASIEFTRNIEIELINENETGDIYYTLDGSEPTINSNKYFFSLNFFNSKTLKFKTISETAESETITEIYKKKWEVKNIMSDGRVGQSSGIMRAEVKLYGEADTEYQYIGDVPLESAEQFKSTDAPVLFKNKRTGNNAVFARNNPGEQHYTVEVDYNSAVEAFLSSSILEVDGKYYGGANAGRASKEFTLRLRPDYMGDDDSQDILVFKAICKTDIEINSGTDGKALMKLDFTALTESIEIEAPDKPVGTLKTTAGSLAAGEYTYVAFAATNDGRIKSTASTAVTVPGTGTNSIEVAFTVPAGADTIKLYRTVGSEIKSRLCTAAEFKAGKMTDTGALTWVTETVIHDNTTTKPTFTATHTIA